MKFNRIPLTKNENIHPDKVVVHLSDGSFTETILKPLTLRELQETCDTTRIIFREKMPCAMCGELRRLPVESIEMGSDAWDTFQTLVSALAPRSTDAFWNASALSPADVSWKGSGNVLTPEHLDRMIDEMNQQSRHVVREQALNDLYPPTVEGES